MSRPARESLLLRRTAAARLGKSVYDVEDVTMAYGGRVLLDDVTWRVGPGDRFGLIGVNGAGKSTLLRLLDGRVPPQSGRVKVGQTVRPAYLTQDVAELDPEQRVLTAVEETGKVLQAVDPRAGSGSGRELTAGQLLESFGFRRPPGNGRGSVTCPAGSGAGCRSCGCCSAEPTCCCWTSRPTTWTSRRCRRSRTCSTPGPARSSWSATIGGSSSASPTPSSR